MRLRLLLFEECNRNCSGCCNKQWDLKSLPVAKTFEGYEEILLTGGEPMLYPHIIIDTIKKVREQTRAPIYIYTALTNNINDLLTVYSLSDGLCITLHEEKDILPFINFNEILLAMSKYLPIRSLRLNIFSGMEIQDVNLSLWKIKKDIEWIDPCPLPKGEVFMRLNTDN